MARIHSERSLMNALTRKLVHIALAAVLLWIVVYGIGYAKPDCCLEMAGKCFQASERAQSDPTVAVRCETTVPARPLRDISLGTGSSCCDPLDACCNTPGNSASMPAATSVFRTSDSPDSSGTANTVAADLDRPEISGQKPARTDRTIPPSKTPCYIQLRSILC